MFLIFLILCFVIKTFCCGGSYSDIWELVTYSDIGKNRLGMGREMDEWLVGNKKFLENVD